MQKEAAALVEIASRMFAALEELLDKTRSAVFTYPQARLVRE